MTLWLPWLPGRTSRGWCPGRLSSWWGEATHWRLVARLCVCVIACVSVFRYSRPESGCVFRCQACRCGSADSWSPWAVSLPGPSPCWPACWSRRSQSLRPTRRLLLSSCPSYQHWCGTHTHRQILFTLLLIFIFSLSVQSESLHINPLHTLIPSTMCVSFGVMLPVGNPPNAIVFSYGHVQIKDMVRLTHTLFTCLKLLSVK